MEKRIPKCTCCGAITKWKLDPVIRGIDWLIFFVLLLFFFVPGFIYLIIVAVIRSNPNNRDKICPKCGARNLWTFIYDESQ